MLAIMLGASAAVVGLVLLVLLIAVLMPAMASPIQGTLQQGVLMMGQNGRLMQWGTAAFVTTGATVAVPVNMRNVECFIITACNVTASDEILSGPNILSTGIFNVPAAGTVTVTRTGASKTSGLAFSYLAIGS